MGTLESPSKVPPADDARQLQLEFAEIMKPFLPPSNGQSETPRQLAEREDRIRKGLPAAEPKLTNLIERADALGAKALADEQTAFKQFDPQQYARIKTKLLESRQTMESTLWSPSLDSDESARLNLATNDCVWTGSQRSKAALQNYPELIAACNDMRSAQADPNYWQYGDVQSLLERTNQQFDNSTGFRRAFASLLPYRDKPTTRGAWGRPSTDAAGNNIIDGDQAKYLRLVSDSYELQHFRLVDRFSQSPEKPPRAFQQ